MTEPIRLLIADDHPVFRDGLASLLDPLPGIEVVARASDGAEAVALAAEHRPDVVIMDVQMPVMNGIDATRAVVAARPEVGRAGADDGRGRRHRPVRAARRSTRLPAQGRRAGRDRPRRLDRARRRRGLRRLAGGTDRRGAGPRARPERPFPELTERETEVLDLIAAGRNNGQIAQQLFLSPKTIRNNITSILAKLQATDRADVIIRARDAGLGREGEDADPPGH